MCSVLCVILLRVLLESATQRQTDAPFRSPSSNCTGIRINITPEIHNPLAQSCFYWDFSEGEVRLSQVALVRQHLLVNILFYFHWKWEMLVWRMGWGGSWSLTNFPSIPCRGWDQMKHISLCRSPSASLSVCLSGVTFDSFSLCLLLHFLLLNSKLIPLFRLQLTLSNLSVFHVVFHHRCPFSSSLSFLLFLSFVSLSFSLPPCWAGKPLMWSRYLFMQVIHQHRVAFKAMSRKPDQ